MMTAEQLREAWANWNMDGTYIKKLSLADCRIIDERVIAFAESLRAQLAEKERECKEQEIMLGQRNFEIGQLKGMFQKNFTWIDNGTCLELHNRRAEAAEERLQEAQGRAERAERFLRSAQDTGTMLDDEAEAAWDALGMDDYEGENDLAYFITQLRDRLRQRESELEQALALLRDLPLDRFGDDMGEHDAAEFVDNAGSFFDVMFRAKKLLALPSPPKVQP